MLPRVKIDFSNGALGQVSASADGVIGVLCTGAPVAGKFVLNTPYKITQFSDLETVLGITVANNPGMVKLFTELFDQSGDGVEVWLKAFADTVTMTTMCTLATTAGIQDLLQTANGKIRTIIVHRTPAVGYTATITAGLDGDVATAMAAAQVAATWAADTLKAPVLILIAGLYYSGTASALTDLTTSTNNRVGIMIGDTVSGNGCAIGILGGKLALAPVMRHIGRVKDGALLGLSSAYLATTLVEKSDVGSIHDKGYIALRTHVGRSGYYFTDDPLATPVTDDYNHITARRTVDKAYRIAYDTLLNELLDEVPVTDAGLISVAYAKSVETKVENAIINSMTINGELGNDPANQNDTGVTCWIDNTQNIVATGLVSVTLKVKPYGYARYITVQLGFKTLTA
ncbi:MAG: DUF2586 family protein [Bacteroidota bacterium]